jgi:DeoR/GlpR family transcriptional regulator of sugar metabolism
MALDFDAEKIAVKQCAMERAGTKALIADSGKFLRNARLEVAHLSAFDIIVTNEALPEALAGQRAQICICPA